MPSSDLLAAKLSLVEPHMINLQPEKIRGMDLGRIRNLFATVGNLALPLLIVITSLMDFVPFEPCFPVNDLDSGWAFGLNAALAKGLVFGRDIIFTFGPYGSVYTEQYHPAIDTQMLWSSGLLAIAFAIALVNLTQRFRRLIALGLALFLAFVPRDTQLFAIPFVSLLLACRVAMPLGCPERIALTLPIRLTLALLVVALSLLTLVKGSFGLASVAVIMLGCIALVMRGYKALAIGGVILFFVALAVLWMLAGQPLGFLPGFFLAQEPIISGYSTAMSWPGPVSQIALYVVCCVLIWLLHAPTLRSAGTVGAVFFVGSAALLFLAFKEAFVRDDLHSLVGGGMLGVAGWAMLLLGRKGIFPALGLLVGLIGWVPNLHAERHNMRQFIDGPFLAAEHGLVTRLMDPDQLKQSYANSLTTIQAEQPLPKLVGTTDIYSYGQSALLANGLDWAPRPVLQSYSAYTPDLAYKDAEYLTGANAPTNILFAVQPIDNRLAALEDGASWPIILTHYEFTGFCGNLAILQKRSPSLIVNPIADVPSVSGTFELGMPIALPENTPVVWAKINVRPTLFGKIITLLFKPSQLRITYIFSSGSSQTFRYIAGMGISGFIAAPLITDTTDFGALARPDAAHYFMGRQPKSLVITADYGVGWLWRSSFTAQFFAAQFPIQPEVVRRLFSPLERESSQISKLPTPSDCSIDNNQQLAIRRPVRG